MTTDFWIQTAWGDQLKNATFADIDTAIKETIEMDEEHGAFWAGHNQEGHTLEVEQDLTLSFLYGEELNKQLQIKLTSWEEVKHFYKLFFNIQFDQIIQEMESHSSTFS